MELTWPDLAGAALGAGPPHQSPPVITVMAASKPVNVLAGYVRQAGTQNKVKIILKIFIMSLSLCKMFVSAIYKSLLFTFVQC